MFDLPKLAGIPTMDSIAELNKSKADPSLMGTLLNVEDKPTVPQAMYDDLVHYFKYASTAYSIIMPGPIIIPLRPNGAKLVKKISDLLTDTRGYIARDDKRKEIVVVFRGSVSPMNFLTDFAGLLVAWNDSSVEAPAGTQIHMGFQHAWGTVSATVMAAVKEEASKYPDYNIVVTGHSLGGALSSIASLVIQSSLPNRVVRVYTYGAPRVGNATFARWHNTVIEAKRNTRVVHSYDGVPTMALELVGFAHHGTEHWAFSPPSASRTHICVEPGELEDPRGSKKIPTTGINPAHLLYFGIPYVMPFLL